jgi:hypothetical protein
MPLAESFDDRDVDQRGRCGDDVERRVGKLRQRRRVALNELDIGEARRGRLSACFRQHALREVHADDSAALAPDLTRRVQGGKPGPGPGIENPIGRFQPAQIDEPLRRSPVPAAVTIPTRPEVERGRDLFPSAVHCPSGSSS